MGETIIDTSSIVASNLTIAYCARHPEIADEEKIIEVYRRFVELLRPKGDRYDPQENQSFGQQNY